MKRYRCTSCGYVYDPMDGDPENGIPPGTLFEQLPEEWYCPVCGVPKSEFVQDDW
jgi:rubredoxin